MNPLALATSAQRESYAQWAERAASKCHGRMREFLRGAAEIARVG